MRRARAWLVAAILGVALTAFAGFPRSGGPAPSRAMSTRTRAVSERGWVVSDLDKTAYLKDLETVTRDVTLKPIREASGDGVVELCIQQLRTGSPLHVAGFRVGDRIVTINGQPPGSMNRVVNLMHEVRDARNMTVQIRRDAVLLDFSFEFR